MTNLPITSAFNDGYIAERYEAFQRDPASVDESWRQLFRFAAGLAGGGVAATADSAALRKAAGAAGLVRAIRQYGHLAVPLDPLGSAPHGAAELAPEFHGITEQDLQALPGSALGFDDHRTAAEAVARLRELYSSRIGYEFEHLDEEAEREWIREAIEGGAMPAALSADERLAALRRLIEVDSLERFLGRAYQGYKRFSIEGTDALIPMLDAVIAGAAHAGAAEVVIGMAHRGRINVLAHTLNKPYATIFSEFEGKHAATNAASETGDVKYHLGYRSSREIDGRKVGVRLVPNPSHLEFVDPVVEGVTRALQRAAQGAPASRGAESERDGVPGALDVREAFPVLVHGDAAFPGEGVVAETLNLSRLAGFRTGGTLHLISNNQVGFTTDPAEGRSTYYASDLAKGFEVPIVHVNGDDIDSCLIAVRLGLAYRERFEKDFLIDLVGYRRQGHNETDEAAFTQPVMSAAIRAHPAPWQVWGERLVSEGVLSAEDLQAMAAEVMSGLERVHGEPREKDESAEPERPERQAPIPEETSVPADRLIALNERMLSWPSDFHPMPRLAKQLERRRSALIAGKGDTSKDKQPAGTIDWGHAEALAFASLLSEGTPIRLTGQDVERGTFSHRHDVLHDHETGATYTPLQHIPGAAAPFEIYNSPLSETAVLGFEYGYSVAATEALVLWEAQFGDFANVAQPIIDQFIVSDRAKWGQTSGLVLLLPHGYEGQGPEHSSARLERFLQLAADGELRVANLTTPAQYFHILRRQAMDSLRRPLVLMQPKSLLRMPEAASRLADLATGHFQPVIDDPAAAGRETDVRRLVFCSGKLYYDLAAAERGPEVALVRVEQLAPWPHAAVAAIVDRYRAVAEIVWAQEEPKNMGAWAFAAPRLHAAAGNTLPVRYIGRRERASPAEGYQASHKTEQARIVAEVLGPSGESRTQKRKTARASK